MGDQPEAIEQLVGSIRHGSKHNTLLGVTGSGKTFTVANVVAQLNRPTLVLSHNKTLAAQLYGEFRNFFPRKRRGVFRLLLRLLPGRRPTCLRRTPISKKTFRSMPRSRKLRLRTVATLLSGRRDVIVVVERVVSLRRGQSRGFPRHGDRHQGRTDRQLQALPLQAGRSALHPHRAGAGACDVPRERRHGGHHGGVRRVWQPVFPRDVLRQRDRSHPDHRPRDGTAHPFARQPDALPHESSS